ncbi:hydroxymethylglutaryl-CoA synthase family protein [Chloroflexota bacterium]
MTLGIEAFGAYVPIYRLKRQEIARAWSTGAPPGEKSVANFDEDTITMAVAAAMDCLHATDIGTIDGCYFATNSSPFTEKQGAALIATALNLRREVSTIDFTDSLRCGTTAMKCAFDAVKAGSSNKILLVVAESRLGAPRSEFEQSCGDGAVAFLIGNERPVVVVKASYTHGDEIFDVWKGNKEEFLRTHEDRFVLTQGYFANVQEAVSKIMERQKVTNNDFAKVCIYGPDSRRHRELVKKLGFDLKTQVQDQLLNEVGNTGASLALMMLVSALEQSQPNDKILLASYGSGCDAFIFETTPEIGRVKGRLGIEGHLASKRYLASYEKYIMFRQLMVTDAGRRPYLVSSPTVLWRDRKWVLGFSATRCLDCGRLFFPPQRVCYYCRSKDNFEYVPLAKRQGTIYSFTKDNLAQCPDPPEVFATVHLDDVRVFCRMTDRDPDNISIGMPVEMTFRRIHEGGGYPNYFWKCMPMRKTADAVKESK